MRGGYGIIPPVADTETKTSTITKLRKLPKAEESGGRVSFDERRSLVSITVSKA